MYDILYYIIENVTLQPACLHSKIKEEVIFKWKPCTNTVYLGIMTYKLKFLTSSHSLTFNVHNYRTCSVLLGLADIF